MQTNDGLIVNFFHDHQEHRKSYREEQSSFVFDALYDLAHNKDVTPSYKFGENLSYGRDGFHSRSHYRNELNRAVLGEMSVDQLRSLTGLKYAFILDGFTKSFKPETQRMGRDEFYDDEESYNGNSFMNPMLGHMGHKQNAIKPSKEALATIKFMEKCRGLHSQLYFVIDYLMGYYSYSLSVDYSELLKNWEEQVPSLHMTCAKEVKELKKIISSTQEANTFFKERYATFVDFVIKSGAFVDMFVDAVDRKHSNYSNHYNESRSFFGHLPIHDERKTEAVANEKNKELFAEQERLLTDFIEANKDILISREAHEIFNHANLVADYKKVLKICEILVEKTNVHMQCKYLKGILFLTDFAERHDDIMRATDFTGEFRELGIVASIGNIKNASITDAIVFDDKSVVVKKKGYEGFEYSPSSFVGIDLILDGFMAEINHMLRKNPSMNKAVKFLMANIKNKHINNKPAMFNTFKGLKVGLRSYFDNENILKAHGFDLITEMKSSKTFEEFDDKIHKIVRKHKIEQYAMSIVSNKYKNLYSDRTLAIMEELYDMGISTHILQDMIGKKMAGIKNTRSLNSALKSLLNSINGFEISNIKMKAAANNVNVLFESEDYLVLEIDTFKKSKTMGSPSWCISREDFHFNSYVEGGNIQVFAYDFSLTSKDNKSVVGLTLTRHMKVHAAHSKNDSELRDNQIKDKLIKIVAEAKGIVPKGQKPKAA